jgi:hypothetical protein
MTSVCAAVLTALIAIAAPVSLVADSPQSPKPSTGSTDRAVDEKDLIWWLPADTESVVAARGPFLIPTGSDKTSDENDPAWFTRKTTPAEIRAAFEALPLEVFYDLDLTKMLKGSTVAYALQGSRHFRSPQAGSEVMEFEGCSIIVFEKALDKQVNTIEQTVAKNGARSETIGGTRVLVTEEKSEESVSTDLLAFPRSNVLLVANNRNYMQEVLARMAQKKASRALPDQLPEWGFLDANARFWGLRHYDPTQAKLDPTSPFGEDRTFDPGDPKAIGVLFALDPKNEQSLVMTSLTGDEAQVKAEASSGKRVSEPQEGVRFEVKVRSPKPGALEYIFTLDRSSTLDYSILSIEFVLGRGMYF